MEGHAKLHMASLLIPVTPALEIVVGNLIRFRHGKGRG